MAYIKQIVNTPYIVLRMIKKFIVGRYSMLLNP